MTDQEIIDDIKRAYLELIVHPKFVVPRNAVAELMAKSLHRIPWLLEQAKVKHWTANITVTIPEQQEAAPTAAEVWENAPEDWKAEVLEQHQRGVEEIEAGNYSTLEEVKAAMEVDQSDVNDAPDAWATAQKMGEFTAGDDVVILDTGEMAKVSYFKRDTGKVVVITEEGIGVAKEVDPSEIQLKPAPQPQGAES